MEEIEFLIQGSAQEPYQVKFRKNGTKITAYCTCMAGESGMYCKHRLDILTNGKTSGIISNNANDAMRVSEWLPGSNIEQAMTDIRNAEITLAVKKKEVEKLLDEPKKSLSAAKQRLAAMLLR